MQNQRVDPRGGAGRRDQEERDFQDFARSQDPTAEERILSHMAPGIFGHENIKRAVACLLFGGTRKVCHPALCARCGAAYTCVYTPCSPW